MYQSGGGGEIGICGIWNTWIILLNPFLPPFIIRACIPKFESRL